MKKFCFILAVLTALTFVACEGADVSNPESETVSESSEISEISEVSETSEPEESSEEDGEHGRGFFNVIDDEPFFEYREDGKHYGFETDFWEGCSVWCAVNDYRISAKASSTLAPQGKISYDASNIYNSDRGNTWIEGVDGYGVGEYIEITRRYEVADEEYGVDFVELCVVNGYAQTLEKWAANSRVKDLKFYFNGEYVEAFCLEDTIEPQYFDLKPYKLHSASGAESVFRFEIVSVYPGEKYDDTALTGIEIDFWTPNH